ncbi:MAG: tripartite tricarboxylate transporter TctB family protein [Rhodobacteraceae bacterium]|jgi:hypothetical protein|nr:tripartite tricarboxylate transporter TctB family protein [Paracoccaceae bacterium]
MARPAAAGSRNPAARRDAITGAVLLVLAVAWSATVWLTVSPGRFGVGPRAFPLYLGLVLALLSALLLLTGLRGLRRTSAAAAPAGDDGDSPAGAPLTGWPLVRILGSVTAIMAAYGFLMQGAGFVVATAAVVAVTMWFALGIRRPVMVLATAAGITAGTWLGFGVVLGAYLPRGTWYALF